jgi:hypothetical protein
MKLRILLFLSLAIAQFDLKAQSFDYPWAFNTEQPGDFIIPRDIDVDAAGNSYVLFNFSETLQIGNIQFAPEGQTDIGVVKISPEGETLWGAAAASASSDQGNAITVNSAGEVFITGYYTDDIQFDDLVLPANGSNGATEFFVAKIGTDGFWSWAKQQTGSAIAAGNAIDSDGQGNIVVGGSFYGADLIFDNVTFAAQEQLPFLVKLNSTGEVIWSFNPETPYGANLGGLTIDNAGNVYMCGSFGTFEDVEVLLSAGKIVLTNVGDPEASVTAADMYVLALSADGIPLWGKNAGSLYFESFASSIAVDNTGQVYVAGIFQDSISNVNTSLGATGGESDYDYYLASLSSSGEWLWLNRIGNSDFNTGSVLLRSSTEGYIYLAGNLETQAFDFGTFSLSATETNSSFLARINTDGSYRWGFNHPAIYSAAIYSENSFRITGNFATPSITLGSITLNATGGVNADMYTCRLNYTPLIPDGITQISTDQPIVFPNPFANQITVSSSSDEILQVTVFDLLGRELEAEVNYQGRSALVIPSASANGCFVVKIKTQDGIKTFPVARIN